MHKTAFIPLLLLNLLTANVLQVDVNQHNEIIIVNNDSDSGVGSFREALEKAVPGTRIKFDQNVFPPDEPATIYLQTELPVMSQGEIVIDASDAGVILDGSSLNIKEDAIFDEMVFLVNGDLIFQSDFRTGSDGWYSQDASQSVFEVNWEQKPGYDSMEGVLEIQSTPIGTSMIAYHAEAWTEDLYGTDSSPWIEVTPGDRVEFRYWYKGSEHVPFFTVRGAETGGPQVISESPQMMSEDWRQVTISATVEEGVDFIFPAVRLKSDHHGAGLFLESDHNEIYGLYFKKFESGILIFGEGNKIGKQDENAADGCVESCNLFTTKMGGISVEGSENIISGNWFELDKDHNNSGMQCGINVVGGHESTGIKINSNRFINAATGILIGNTSNAIINDNIFGVEDMSLDHVVDKGIHVVDFVTALRIGPKNIFINNSQNAIALTGSTIANTAVFDNEILGSGECGILVLDTQGTQICQNYMGIDRSGAGFPNQYGICLNQARQTQIGPDNTIFYSLFNGIGIGDSPQTQITENDISENEHEAISIWGYVGDEPDPPLITGHSHTTLTINGEAEPGSIVELYYDKDNEGGEFAVSCITTAQGKFYCTIPDEDFKTDVNVTALARRPDGGTSVLSEPYFLPEPDYAVITGITGPQSISTDPQVIGISVGIAGMLLFIFNSLAEVSTGLLDELFSKNNKILKHTSSMVNRMVLNSSGHPFVFYAGWAGILMLTAFAQSMLEDYRIFSTDQIQLTGLLLLVLAVLSLVEVGSEWAARRSWGMDRGFGSIIDFRTLLFVGFSVALSRLLNFSPGIIIGVVGVVFLKPDFSQKQKGPAALIILASLFVISMTAWGLSAVFVNRTPILETICLTIFFFGIQQVFFSLIPYQGSGGRKIMGWKKIVWIVFSVICTTVFVYMIFMPAFTDVDAMRNNDYVTLYIIGGVLALATGLLWAENKLNLLSKRLKFHK
jgi:hypothetical protein